MTTCNVLGGNLTGAALTELAESIEQATDNASGNIDAIRGTTSSFTSIS